MASIEAVELGRWFELEATALVFYASQWLDRGAAEDVVQDVFVILMAQGRRPDNVKAWLYRAVRNAAFKQLRGRQRREAREVGFAGVEPDLEDRTETVLDARQAEAALASLPADEREIVTLRIWGGLTLDEIAAVVDVSTPTVFRKYRGTIEKLRQALHVLCPLKIN